MLPPTQRPSRAHQPHSGIAVHDVQDAAVAHTGLTGTIGVGTIGARVSVDSVSGGGLVSKGVLLQGTGSSVGTGVVVVKNTSIPAVVVGTSVVVRHSLHSCFILLSLPSFKCHKS